MSSGGGVMVPYLQIVDQPLDMRFRYEQELQKGQHGFSNVKLKLVGYQGRAEVTMKLLTAGHHPQPHVNRIIVKKGVYRESMSITVQCSHSQCEEFNFQFGVLRVTKNEIRNKVQKDKKTENPFITQKDLNEIANTKVKEFDTKVVRLCFEVTLQDGWCKVENTYSQAIQCKKKLPAVKICHMSLQRGKTIGGEKVFLLCNPLENEEVTILFREGDAWIGKVTNAEKHCQTALIFNTPPYSNTTISICKRVDVLLLRNSDGMESAPVHFVYECGSCTMSRCRCDTSTSATEAAQDAGTDLDRIKEKQIKDIFPPINPDMTSTHFPQAAMAEYNPPAVWQHRESAVVPIQESTPIQPCSSKQSNTAEHQQYISRSLNAITISNKANPRID